MTQHELTKRRESAAACPPDDAYSRLLQGLLGPEERSELELHLDRCPNCTELVAELGKIYSPTGVRERTLDLPARGPAARPAGGPRASTVTANTAPHAQAPAQSLDASRWRREGSRLLFVEAATALVHLVWTLLTLSLLWEPLATLRTGVLGVPADGASMDSGWRVALACYLIIWPPVGTLWATVAVVGLARGQRWGRRAAIGHAILSLPSLVLAPLALLALLHGKRPARARE